MVEQMRWIFLLNCSHRLDLDDLDSTHGLVVGSVATTDRSLRNIIQPGKIAFQTPMKKHMLTKDGKEK